MTGIIYENNDGDKFIILMEKKSPRKSGNSTHTRCLVQFLSTGSTRWVYKENISQGKVKDRYKISVYGVGYLGDIEVKYKTPYYAKAKQLWTNMLKRCYTDDPKGYKKWGTKVDPRWHCLENFIADIPLLDNFDKWLDSKTTGIRYNLDKDFKIPDSNIYSVNTCSFIEESLNKSAGAKTTVKNYFRTSGKRLVAEA